MLVVTCACNTFVPASKAAITTVFDMKRMCEPFWLI
jgi:hypothetical protein